MRFTSFALWYFVTCPYYAYGALSYEQLLFELDALSSRYRHPRLFSALSWMKNMTRSTPAPLFLEKGRDVNAKSCDFKGRRNTAQRDSSRPPLILLFLALAFLVCALVITIHRQAKNRAWDKRRNQYHDRL